MLTVIVLAVVVTAVVYVWKFRKDSVKSLVAKVRSLFDL